FGPGRMAEPLEIVAAIEQALGAPGVLSGFKALVTAGPTHEPLDPVRFLANRSSGKQGYAVAGALAEAGAETVLVSGPVEIAAPARVKLLKVTTAREMIAACEAELPADIAVMTAAVADWRPDIAQNSKIKKDAERKAPALHLIENPDILASLAKHKKRPRLVIGFAAETDEVMAHARSKRTRKGADWIVANDVSGDVMGGDRNQVHLITAKGEESWPDMTKTEVAERLVRHIAQQFQGNAA
ncbi:MAG TPA: phosphopantothenoylcysteine decarboxylase, partial [Rhizomicrobium sp.]|nr:phosphopantothenoylcysteine decarboxylase [Rhizomicrobium sp.]